MDKPKQPANVDTSDPETLFRAIYARVENTTLYPVFLNILSFIFQIDNSEAESEQLWNSIERFIQKRVSERTDKEAPESSDPPSAPPSDPGSEVVSPPPTPPCPGGAPPPPPPPPPPRVPGQGSTSREAETVLPPIRTPDPTCKLKHIAWIKTPTVAITAESIWAYILKMDDKIKVDYNELEIWFVDREPDQGKTMARRRSFYNEVKLLDQQKSANVNIFLKHFKKPIEEIIGLLRKGDHREFGVEELKSLAKILPQEDEIVQIQHYDGSIDKLDEAEKFYHYLIQLPNFQFRVEAMILKGDFDTQIDSIKPKVRNVQALQTLHRLFYENDSLKIFLRYILHTGNFLNTGSWSGNALGIRISSLEKLMNTKSTSSERTLLHYLVETSVQKNPYALAFVNTLLEPLQKISRFSMESITEELDQLNCLVCRLKCQNEHIGDETKVQFTDFLEKAENDLSETQKVITGIQEKSTSLAQYFCENEKTFNLDEFLSTFRKFCEKIKACQQELKTLRTEERVYEKTHKAQKDN